MGIIKDVYSLDPLVAKKTELFIQKCVENNTPVFIVETLREEITGLIYALQGRFDAKDTEINPDLFNELNRLRKKYKFWELTKEEFNKKVTTTLESNHLKGKALDFCPMKNGKLDWNAPLDVWEKCGKIAESIGFTWGGRWKRRDLPHIEWDK